MHKTLRCEFFIAFMGVYDAHRALALCVQHTLNHNVERNKYSRYIVHVCKIIHECSLQVSCTTRFHNATIIVCSDGHDIIRHDRINKSSVLYSIFALRCTHGTPNQFNQSMSELQNVIFNLFKNVDSLNA